MAKAAPFKAAKVPEVPGAGPLHEITRAALVALIVDCLGHGETTSEKKRLRKRVSDKVRYHIGRDLCCGTSGLFRLGDVGLWAAKEWPGRFEHLPKSPIELRVATHQLGQTASTTAYVLPDSLSDCHREISSLHAQIALLARDMGALEIALKKAQARLARNTAKGNRPKR